MSAPPLAHVRQHTLRDGHGAEHVHVELPTHFSQRRLFHDALVAITGVVHQHIQWPHVCLNFVDDVFERVEVGHVQHPAKCACGVERFKALSCLLASYRADDPIPCCERFFGQCASEAATDASDEHGFG
ncbi:hypothetical protein D3C71_1120070 [compost metagenome]